jgi:hypothetical protein
MEILTPCEVYLKGGNLPVHLGKITIGKHWERFWIGLDLWSLDDYKQQWREGLQRIKDHNDSCLIASYIGKPKNPSLEMWMIYKDNDRLIFHNYWLFNSEYNKNTFRKKPFLGENWHDFIKPRKIRQPGGDGFDEYVIKYNPKEIDRVIKSLK